MVRPKGGLNCGGSSLVLYSSCVAEFRGNLFSFGFVFLIGLCNLNNLLGFLFKNMIN